MKKIILFILFTLFLVACSNSTTSNTSSSITTTTSISTTTTTTTTISTTKSSNTTSSEDLNMLKGELLINEHYIKLIGRYSYNETTKCPTLYFTASGFKVRFYGTSLSAMFNPSGSGNNCAVIHILVDGEVYPEGKTILVNQSMLTKYTLCEGLEEGYHEVEVLKRSEAVDNTLTIRNLETDGKFAVLNEETTKTKMLVLGDSFTAGYGNLTTSTTDAKNALNSDGLKAFPYLTARMLDFDVEYVNASGWGVKYGYNDHKNGTVNIPYMFNYSGVSGQTVSTIEYDLNRFVPDVIMYEIGLNDFYSVINMSSSLIKQAKIKEFEEATKAFILRLHELYPNAKVFITYEGYTDVNRPGKYVKKVSDEINAEYGTFIYDASFEGCVVELVSDNHPSVKSNILMAEAVTTAIENVLGITRVRENITIE